MRSSKPASQKLKHLFEKLASLRFGPLSFPIVLLGLLLLCFGYALLTSNFFWDDWVQLLSRKLYGLNSYWAYFYERPTSAWTHILAGPLLGFSAIRWKFFTLFLRFICILLAWLLFRLVWPGFRREALLAALLFGFYPGFTQQPISVAYHQHWLQYDLFLASFIFMIFSLRQRKRFWLYTLLGLVCQVLQLSITEFFVGVELLRPLLIWAAISNEGADSSPMRSKVAAVLRTWAPYFILLLAFSIWRVAFFQLSPGQQNTPSLVYALAGQPLATTLRLANYALIDALNVIIVAWGKVFDLRLVNASQPMILYSWIGSVAVALGLVVYLSRLKPSENESETGLSRWAQQAAWIGLVGVIIGPSPLWAADQNILSAMDKDIYHSDRFTLAAMLWASLLVVGLFSLLAERWKQKAVLTAIVIGLLFGFQVRSANDYRWLWQSQARFYWQLFWRAPYIQPQTALISEDILFPFQGLFSDAGAINLLYPQPSNPQQVAYWVYSILPRYPDRDPLANPVGFSTHHRIFTFSGQTPDSLVFSYGEQNANCLWILTPEDTDLPEAASIIKWLPVSNLERIQPQPVSNDYPAAEIFGSEPEHGWCYFFEKASLARQFKDWQTVASLADQARAAGFRPDISGSNSAYEWWPFIDGYARTGRWREAQELTLASFKWDKQYGPMLCNRWKQLNMQAESGTPEQADAFQLVHSTLGCS